MIKSGLGVKVAIGVIATGFAIGGIAGAVSLSSKGGNSSKPKTEVSAGEVNSNMAEKENRLVKATYYGDGYSVKNADGMQEYRDKYHSYTLDDTRVNVVRNKDGNICYYKNEGDEQKIVCENPITKEEIYSVDLTKLLYEEGCEVRDVDFGNQYVTMCTGKDIAIDLSTGEVVLDLKIYEDGKGQTKIYTGGDYMVLCYQEQENYTLTSYTVYDKDGKTSTPCSDELLKKINAFTNLAVAVRNDEVYVDGFSAYSELYKSNTLERVMEDAEYVVPEFTNRHCELWRDPQTEKLCLITQDSAYGVTDVYKRQYTNRDGSLITTELIYTNENDGKRYYHSMESGFKAEVTSNFTEQFIMDSSNTIMSYKDKDGNTYFYDIESKKETKLELPNESVMAALTNDKFVYALPKDQNFTFIVMDVNTGKETEIETVNMPLSEIYNHELEYISTEYNKDYFEAEVSYYDPADDMGASYERKKVRYDY